MLLFTCYLLKIASTFATIQPSNLDMQWMSIEQSIKEHFFCLPDLEDKWNGSEFKTIKSF